MTCKKCHAFLFDLLDDELSVLDVKRIQEHLYGCEKCQQFIQNEKTRASFFHDLRLLRRLHYRGGVPPLTEAEALDPEWKKRGLPLWILSAQRRPLDVRTSRRQYHLWGIAAGAVLMLLGLSGFFLLRPQHDTAAGPSRASMLEIRLDSVPRVQVISVELKGKPAKPFIFQTPKASFIWIAPSKDMGG